MHSRSIGILAALAFNVAAHAETVEGFFKNLQPPLHETGWRLVAPQPAIKRNGVWVPIFFIPGVAADLENKDHATFTLETLALPPGNKALVGTRVSNISLARRAAMAQVFAKAWQGPTQGVAFKNAADGSLQLLHLNRHGFASTPTVKVFPWGAAGDGLNEFPFATRSDRIYRPRQTAHFDFGIDPLVDAAYTELALESYFLEAGQEVAAPQTEQPIEFVERRIFRVYHAAPDKLAVTHAIEFRHQSYDRYKERFGVMNPTRFRRLDDTVHDRLRFDRNEIWDAQPLGCHLHFD